MPGSTKWSLSLRFSHQNPVHASSLPPICATCPAHLILLYLITCTIVGEEYRSLSSSLWSFLHPHLTQAQIFSPTPYSETRSAYVPPTMSATKFHTHTFYLAPGLTLKNSTWCWFCVECFVLISVQTATFALYIINWLVFITAVESVYSTVWTDCLNKADYVLSLKG
jgi:hypothetical protein